MPPPSPVWTRKGEYHNATFRMDVKIEGGWYTSDKVRLNVKGAPKSKGEPDGAEVKAPARTIAFLALLSLLVKHPCVVVTVPFAAEALVGYEGPAVFAEAVTDDIRRSAAGSR